ncbi:MAG TPA: uracil-DNA glycosylase, partial [Bauldia sp.]|nr:uracil-DNA glycosylase [Bauldia sp.]
MPNSALSRAEAADLIAWYAEAGIDVALDEAPVDRFALPPVEAAPEPRRPSPPPEAPVPGASAAELLRPSAQAAIPSVDETARAARELARSAATLDELRDALGRFEG